MLVRKVGMLLLATLFVALALCCAIELLKISTAYDQQARVAEESGYYRPASSSIESLEGIVINQGIYDLQNEVNSDVMGWLTLDGTLIDYPFVRGSDNDFYLHKDLYKEDLWCGTIFADYRCTRDLSDFNTILYGHSMINHTMFGDLSYFLEQDYFDAHKTGTLSLADGTYQLQIFACVVASSTDPVLYEPTAVSAADQAAFLDYVAQKARCYREVDAPGPKGVLTLSSCNYESNNSRTILLAMIR